MIDFKYTEENNGVVTFVNKKGEAVKTYQLSELEKYVKDTYANLTYEQVGEYSGKGDSNDPANWDGGEIEVYEPINEYLDNNWDEITEKFYHSLNSVDHVAKHNYAYSKEANR